LGLHPCIFALSSVTRTICVDPSCGFLTVSPERGVSGVDDFTHLHFRDLALLLQQPEAFPRPVLWYPPVCLHPGLNPVPSSTFAPGVFSLESCGLCFQKHSVLAFSGSCPVTRTILLVSHPKVCPQDYNGFDLSRCFADLPHLDVAIKDKTTLASYSFSRFGLTWFTATKRGFRFSQPP